MSLLPEQILPETASLGRADSQGSVLIDHNWYLFLYNLALQVLGSGTAQSFPASAVIELASAESDAADTDAVVLRQPVVDLERQLGDIPDPVPFGTIAETVQYAQEPLLQDPVPMAQPAVTVTVSASPFVYTTLSNGAVVVSGGTVSALAVVRQGTSIGAGVVAGVIPVRRLDQISITYTAAPTVTFLPD